MLHTERQILSLSSYVHSVFFREIPCLSRVHKQMCIHGDTFIHVYMEQNHVTHILQVKVLNATERLLFT